MDSPLFCARCRTLHEASGADYFELLGLPRGYDLDAAALRQRYLALSREIHPDRFSDGDAAAAAIRASARVNEALRVLSDPILRAEYLLELSGGPSAAADKSVPEELLNWALLIREEMDDARAAGDAAVLAALREQVQSRRRAALDEAASAARRLPGDEALRRCLRSALNALRYFDRLLEQCGMD